MRNGGIRAMVRRYFTKGATVDLLAGNWLLGHAIHAALLEKAEGFVIDQAAYNAFIERRSHSGSEKGELFIRDGSAAHILITGVLTAKPDFFFDMFGGGSSVYGDIVAAVQAADDDDEISEIVLEIDSPGGSTAGFFRTAKAIANTSKPTRAEVTNLAASAAFGLATQADQVIAEDPMTMIGSVGVATSVFVSESRVQITSTEAPDKLPDVTTSEGIAAVRRELDAIHAEFVAVIASGRGVSVAEVNADFGRGALMVAGDALRSGLIDGIDSLSAPGGAESDPPSSAKANTKGTAMDLGEFKAKYPELYASVFDSGRTAGIAVERDRVTAHVTAAKAVGKPELAAEHIISGVDFSSQAVQAGYLTAGLNRSESDDRNADDAESAGATNAEGRKAGDAPKPDADEHTNAMFDQVESDMDISTRKVEA